MVDQTPQSPAPSQPPARPTPEKQPLKVDLFTGRTSALPPRLSALSERLQAPPKKEQAARWIGTLLVLIFGFASVFVTWEGFHVVSWSLDKPENTKILMTGAVIPFLEKVGTFLTTVFGPLLAFILGYYFSQKTDRS
jgi:hypothetical protein